MGNGYADRWPQKSMRFSSIPCSMDNRAFLCFVILLTVIVEMAEASEMHRLLQVAKSSLPILNQRPMRIAIVGSGYAGLACAYYGCKVADTLAIFGLEDSPGVQKSTCASTISVRSFDP